MRCAQNHWPFLFLLATYTLVLVSFPLSIQAMESYAYAASAEGYYNLANTFAIAAEGARIPDFSQYHPNHPLPHLIASVLYRSTGEFCRSYDFSVPALCSSAAAIQTLCSCSFVSRPLRQYLCNLGISAIR